MNVGLCDLSIEFQRKVNQVFALFVTYELDVSHSRVWRLLRSIVYKTNPIVKKLFGSTKYKSIVVKHCAGLYESSNSSLQKHTKHDLRLLGYSLKPKEEEK